MRYGDHELLNFLKASSLLKGKILRLLRLPEKARHIYSNDSLFKPDLLSSLIIILT